MTTEPGWTEAEILRQAQGNANALAAVSLLYVKDRGDSIEQFARFVAERFAPSWSQLVGRGAVTVARAAAFNPISLGAKLASIDGNDQHASVVIDAAALEAANANFGLSADEYGSMWRILMEEIAHRVGVQFTFERQGGRWTFEFSR